MRNGPCPNRIKAGIRVLSTQHVGVCGGWHHKCVPQFRAQLQKTEAPLNQFVPFQERHKSGEFRKDNHPFRLNRASCALKSKGASATCRG